MKTVAVAVVAAGLALALLPVVVALGMGATVAALPGDAAAATAAADGAAGELALSWALQQVGKPYAWGATGPGAFDCSGLALRAWQAAGVALPRVAADQYGAGEHLPENAAQAGDLIFFATDPGDPSTIVHVGIALGDGRMVDAPHAGALVRVEQVWNDGLVPLATRP
jgi:cell wall-associated NlpC family hydrolase